jgi:hypothetical protein
MQTATLGENAAAILARAQLYEEYLTGSIGIHARLGLVEPGGDHLTVNLLKRLGYRL